MHWREQERMSEGAKRNTCMYVNDGGQRYGKDARRLAAGVRGVKML